MFPEEEVKNGGLMLQKGVIKQPVLADKNMKKHGRLPGVQVVRKQVCCVLRLLQLLPAAARSRVSDTGIDYLSMYR